MRDYNGVTLPDLPDVDINTYPYCFIRADSTTSLYDLFYAQDELTYSSLKTDIRSVTGPRYKVSFAAAATATEWSSNGSLSKAKVGVAAGWPIIWANFDVYDAVDGSLYLAGEYEKTDADASLTISTDGEVTGTTATMNFSCTGLSSSEAVYQVCLYVYKQGGTYTEATNVCQTAFFAGPSFSGSCTFTGLVPETAYEVYGVICRDGAETEASFSAAFTTPEEASPVPAYIGDADGVARQVECIYIGDADGVARKVLQAYAGSETGIAALFWSETGGNA